MTPPTVNPASVLCEHQRRRIPHISADSDQWISYMYSLPDFWDAWHKWALDMHYYIQILVAKALLL